MFFAALVELEANYSNFALHIDAVHAVEIEAVPIVHRELHSQTNSDGLQDRSEKAAEPLQEPRVDVEYNI